VVVQPAYAYVPPSIYGFVSDSTGAPIAGAQVCAGQPTALSPECTQTAESGWYELYGLPAADYRLWFSAAGFRSEYYDDATDITAASLVTVDPTVYPPPNTVAALERLSSIAGTVVDASTSAPVGDINVCASSFTFTGCASSGP